MAIPYLTNLNLQGNEIQNLVLHNANTPPTTYAKAGMIYYDNADTDNGRVLVYNGSAWVSIAGDIESITGTTNQINVSGDTKNPVLSLASSVFIQDNILIGEADAANTTYSFKAASVEVISVRNNAGAAPSQIQIGDINSNDIPVYFKQNGSTAITIDEPRAIGIGLTNPSNLLELQTESGSGVTGSEGIFVKAPQAGSQPVTGYKNPFISIGTAADESVNAYATLYLGSNASATGQESKIEWSDDDFKLSIWATGTSLLKHVEFGDPGESTAKTEFFGNVIVGGDLTINGTTTTVNSTTVTIDDPIFTLGGDTAIADDSKDRGIEFSYNGESQATPNVAVASNVATITKNAHGYPVGSLVTINGSGVDNLDGTYTIASVTTNNYTIATSSVSDRSDGAIGGTITVSRKGFFGYDDSEDKFTFLTDASNSSEVFTGTVGTIVANLEGNVTGNATNITTSASTSVAGKVELATSAETIIGTDTSRAVTPDSLAARSVVATIDVSDATLTAQTEPYKATITHSLGTKDLIVQLQDVTDFAVVHADISTTDFSGAESANKITIGFDNALPANNIRVIITSARGATGGTASYS